MQQAYRGREGGREKERERETEREAPRSLQPQETKYRI